MRSMLMPVLLIFPAALLFADTHGAVANEKVDLSAFKTFVVREGYRTSRPNSGVQATNGTTEVDPKLSQAVREALRSALFSKGIKETLNAPDLVVYFRIEVATQRKEVTGIVVVDLTNTATDTTIWHGQHIDNEESSAKLEKRLPDAIRKMISDNPPKKK